MTVGPAHQRVLASLFSPGVAVACHDAAVLVPDASFEGEPWFEQAAPSRQREFLGGRACAGRVLAELGAPSTHVGRGEAGEPIWPAGFVGSITHAEGLCAAVAARASDVLAIGVDAEVDRSETPAFARRICSDWELSALERLGGSIEALAPVVFSAKEASYKLQFPLTRDAGAWSSLQLALAVDTFSVRILEGALANQRLSGRWRRALGLIWTGIALSKR